jgi:hypothetical protein
MIAFIASIVTWSLGAVMVLLVALGIRHARRTDAAIELLGAHNVKAVGVAS